MLALVMYSRESNRRDLVLYALAAVVCMSSKTTGIICIALLNLALLPFLFRKRSFWRASLVVALLVVVIGASPLLTSWIQYGSPFYPFHTFNHHVEVEDITRDFSGNADALSMGYFFRICYAWVSPGRTIAAIRFLRSNPDFYPRFTVYGGVAGLGRGFCVLLAFSVLLLLFSKKNMITWLCVIIFVSSNFAPLKYIGYQRYFPQIWAIIPLAMLNFAYAPGKYMVNHISASILKWASVAVMIFLAVLSVNSMSTILAFQGRVLVEESYRQELIEELGKSKKEIRVAEDEYLYTHVQRFRQGGVKLVKSEDGEVDTVIHRQRALPCQDSRPDVCSEIDNVFPHSSGIRELVTRVKWHEVLKHLPHVLKNKDAGNNALGGS